MHSRPMVTASDGRRAHNSSYFQPHQCTQIAKSAIQQFLSATT